MRYIDSSTRLLEDTIYGWLSRHLPQASSVAVQSGYYRYAALAPFASDVRRILGGGGRFDLVVGANEERLSAADLDATLALLEPYIPGNASFTLVGARDGLFHPKTYYVELANGERHAAVGSANFTVQGLGHHLEAALLLDSFADDPVAIGAVHDAIVAWRDAVTPHGAARRVTTDCIRELEAERVIDPVSPPQSRRLLGFGSALGQSSFPRLSPIAGLPGLLSPARPRHTTPVSRLGRARLPFPPNSVGIVKRLSRFDVKGFRGEGGTLYVSLAPNEDAVAGMLPMRPYGERGEPRLDVVIEARLAAAPNEIVRSGTDPTNLTHVGMGISRSGNVDLRFNILRGVVSGLTAVAERHRLPVPVAGDALAIEFLEHGRLARLTFVAADPLRSDLLALVIPRRAWGWLSPGVVPSWPAD